MNDAHPAGGSDLLDVHIHRKSYEAASGGSLEVLRDLSFSLARGQVGAFVGPSGCGKTTMLRIIASLDQNFRGTIVRPAEGRLGMVFQEPRLLPWRTVEDNVRLVAAEADEDALASLFAVLELTAHRSHYPGELSLGLARRVALARAFAIKPDVLLLDEPFVSLDDALATRLREELATLVEDRSITTLLVTHDLDEAIRLADRVFLLSSRPAHIVAEFTIPQPRATRSAVDVKSLRADIAAARLGVGPTGQ